MNLIEILRARAQTLPAGGHSGGLRAVLQHVEVAVAHLKRGQETRDETAFTDAIYRTNQAFEGSLKEAYRVLTGKDPNKIRPYDVEMYFQQNAGLRPRVVAQFTNYRTEWRNPSTHDYRLDFDEDEALLAIVSVCAFAIVLIDQIAERLSFDAARAATEVHPPVEGTGPLLPRTVQLLQQFLSARASAGSTRPEPRGPELTGAIAGYLSAAMPEVSILTEAPLGSERRLEADLLVGEPGQRVLIEVKQARATESAVERAMQMVTRYMDLGGLKEAIIYFHPPDQESELVVEERKLPSLGGRVFLLTPRRRPGTS